MSFLELRQSGHPILKREICSRPDVNLDLTLGRGHRNWPVWEAPQRVAFALRMSSLPSQNHSALQWVLLYDIRTPSVGQLLNGTLAQNLSP